MKKVLIGVGVVVALAVVGSLGGGETATDPAGTEPPAPAVTEPNDVEPTQQAEAEERPGSPQVYERIAATEDCAELQEQFDLAAANNDRAEPGTAEAEWTLAYMTAADERMREVGCYDE